MCDKVCNSGHNTNNKMDVTYKTPFNSKVVSSSTTERRKIKNSKPIMEKRRRARINASLTELKTFLLEIIKKEDLRHSKMEKADILELTVKLLRKLQNQPADENADEQDTYIQGYCECASEVTSFLNSVPELKTSIQIKLLEHLSRCADGSKRQTIINLAQTHLNSSQSCPPKISNVPMAENKFTNSGKLDHSKEAEHSSNYYSNTISSENNCIFKQQEIIVPSFNRTDTSNQSMTTPGLCHFGMGQITPGEHFCLNDKSCLPIGSVINGMQLIPARLQSQETAYIIPTNIDSNICPPRVVFAMVTSTTQEDMNTNSGSITNVNKTACNSPHEPILQEQENINRNSYFSKKETSTIVHTGDSCNSNMNSNTKFATNREIQNPLWRPW